MPEGFVSDPEYIREFTLDAADIEEWRIRGYWYLDKRQGELKYRLLGICPVAGEARSKAFEDDGFDSKVELFWVWFPGARGSFTSIERPLTEEIHLNLSLMIIC